VASAGSGTSATVSTASPATTAVSDPAAPHADSRGMVVVPNVDFANEIVQQLMARVSFAANLQIVKTDAQMTSALFDITA